MFSRTSYQNQGHLFQFFKGNDNFHFPRYIEQIISFMLLHHEFNALILKKINKKKIVNIIMIIEENDDYKKKV